VLQKTKIILDKNTAILLTNGGVARVVHRRFVFHLKAGGAAAFRYRAEESSSVHEAAHTRLKHSHRTGFQFQFTSDLLAVDPRGARIFGNDGVHDVAS
jgi:hypothetical protein